MLLASITFRQAMYGSMPLGQDDDAEGVYSPGIRGFSSKKMPKSEISNRLLLRARATKGSISFLRGLQSWHIDHQSVLQRCSM